MALYAIGDVQGCDAELGTLLGILKFSADRDSLWFVGDLVNRGPDSLKVLRRIRALGDSCTFWRLPMAGRGCAAMTRSMTF